MKQSDVKRLITNFSTKLRHNISDDEYAIDLRKYSKTTQILIKSKWEIQSKDWMDWDSKVFFRLWRFIYRDLQRKHGFEDDIKEHDEFVKQWKLSRMEGDYVIVRRRGEKEKRPDGIFSNWMYESERERKFENHIKRKAQFSKRAFNTQTQPWHLSKERIEGARYTAINRFRNMIMSDKPTLDSYMGVSIHDEYTMQGLYNTLMIYEELLSEHMFRDRWETLRIINGTDLTPEWYWGSKYGWMHNTLVTDVTDPRYRPNTLSLHSSQSVSCDVETLTTKKTSNGQTIKWNFTHNMWEMSTANLNEAKYKLTNIKRKDFNPFQEYMFRYFYYYPRRNAEPQDVLQLPKCPYIPSEKSDEKYVGLTERERIETEMYRKKLEMMIDIPSPPNFEDVGPYQIKKVSSK